MIGDRQDGSSHPFHLNANLHHSCVGAPSGCGCVVLKGFFTGVSVMIYIYIWTNTYDMIYIYIYICDMIYKYIYIILYVYIYIYHMQIFGHPKKSIDNRCFAPGFPGFPQVDASGQHGCVHYQLQVVWGSQGPESTARWHGTTSFSLVSWGKKERNLEKPKRTELGFGTDLVFWS